MGARITAVILTLLLMGPSGGVALAASDPPFVCPQQIDMTQFNSIEARVMRAVNIQPSAKQNLLAEFSGMRRHLRALADGPECRELRAFFDEDASFRRDVARFTTVNNRYTSECAGNPDESVHDSCLRRHSDLAVWRSRLVAWKDNLDTKGSALTEKTATWNAQEIAAWRALQLRASRALAETSRPDPASIADALAKNSAYLPNGDTTHCNEFVVAFATQFDPSAVADLAGRANQQIARLSRSSNWEAFSDAADSQAAYQRAAAAAQAGKFVLVGWANPDESASGHIAVVMPFGTTKAGPSFEYDDVPYLAQAGKAVNNSACHTNGVSARLPLNCAFSATMRGQLHFFVKK